MDLSIIIVNFRAWNDLERCLTSLAPLAEFARPSTEIVVVDNASGDGQAERFAERHPQVELIVAPGNHGFAHGCNVGAQSARGEELLFLNPDVIDPGGSVAEFWAIKKQSPEITILTVRQTDESGSPQRVFDAFPTVFNMFGPVRALLRLLMPARYPDAKRGDPVRRSVDWVSGSALMISRADLESLGGWCDEFWMYSEDVDLCRRAGDAGLEVVFDPSVTLIHKHGGSSRRDHATKAMTKAEVTISRHLDAARRLALPARWLFHSVLVVTRYVPRLLAYVLAPLLRLEGLRLESAIFEHLTQYYGSAVKYRTWVSPRSLRHPGNPGPAV